MAAYMSSRGTLLSSPTAQPSCRGICKSLQVLKLQHSVRPVQQRRRSGFSCRAEAAVAEAEAPAAPQSVAASAGLKIQRKGKDLWNDSYYPTGEDAAAVGKPWYIIDAKGQTLGRLAVLAAHHIRGKHLPTYTPSMDMGGYVVIINAEQVMVTGNKFNDKLYRRHTTGRPGSMKIERFKDLQARIPERIIEKAVKGMLTRGRLGNRLFHHLKVYKGASHPHEAQQPADITDKISKKPSESLR
jgi:large subunit ribosomal protein L13